MFSIDYTKIIICIVIILCLVLDTKVPNIIIYVLIISLAIKDCPSDKLAL